MVSYCTELKGEHDLLLSQDRAFVNQNAMLQEKIREYEIWARQVMGFKSWKLEFDAEVNKNERAIKYIE